MKFIFISSKSVHYISLQGASKNHPLLPAMYSLPSITVTKSEQVIATVSAHGNYDATYKTLCALLNLTPSGGMNQIKIIEIR